MSATSLADAVRVTLGPKSRSVLIGKRWSNPIVCNDGVTIARELELADPEEDLGARMLRQAAVRTGDEVGDGTTTSTILAHAIWNEGIRNVVAGASAVDLKRGIERGLKVATDTLLALSRPIQTRTERAQRMTEELVGKRLSIASDVACLTEGDYNFDLNGSLPSVLIYCGCYSGTCLGE
jgi:chaperonin GroEL